MIAAASSGMQVRMRARVCNLAHLLLYDLSVRLSADGETVEMWRVYLWPKVVAFFSALAFDR